MNVADLNRFPSELVMSGAESVEGWSLSDVEGWPLSDTEGQPQRICHKNYTYNR